MPLEPGWIAAAFGVVNGHAKHIKVVFAGAVGDLFVGVGQSLKQVFGPLSNQIGLGVKANAGKVLGKDFADAWDLRKVCGHGSGARQFALDRGSG